MTPYEDIAPNLPFPNAIDWQNTVLFGGGLQCSMNEQVRVRVRVRVSVWVRVRVKVRIARP